MTNPQHPDHSATTSPSTASSDRREAHRAGAGTAAVDASITGGKPEPVAKPSLGTPNQSMVSAAGRRQVSDGAAAPVLPDTLNVGIALRVLLVLGSGLLISVLLISSPSQHLMVLSELSLFVAPVLFASMLIFGFARGAVNGWSRQSQWMFALIVPVVLTVLVSISYLQFVSDVTTDKFLWIASRAIAASAITGALVEYLSLRSRAFSPSLSEARLQALQARIRPHFLFNSLNTVLGLMRSQPRVAETTLENLSELFRVFMRDTRELIPLQDEVETCRQYLAIEQIRLGGRLTIDWQIEGGPADALVPSLLLQPLVENAVHHGVEPSGEAGTIKVSIFQRGQTVHVEVINPLLEESPTRPGNQMALGNVRERLMLLYDMEAALTTEARGSQFCLSLTFPYRKERRRRDVRSYLNNPDR